jgi:hypothetical protein
VKCSLGSLGFLKKRDFVLQVEPSQRKKLTPAGNKVSPQTPRGAAPTERNRGIRIVLRGVSCSAAARRACRYHK